MLNFTTTTIVNSTSDLFKGSLASSGRLYVKNVGSFTADEIKKVYKKAPTAEVLATKSFTPSNSGPGMYRLMIDIELHKSDSSIYARPWPTKGKPLYIEAIIQNSGLSDAAKNALIDALANNATKYMNLVYDKAIVSVTAEGTDSESSAGTLTITALDGHQNFKAIVLEEWVEDKESYSGGHWETVDAFYDIKGAPAFGDYKHLIQSVALPTYENTRDAILDVDGARANVPMLSGSYTQYVITKEADRDPYGMQAVGQKLTSVTEHVFWVESNAVSAFETAFGGSSKFDANDANKDGYELVSILED